MNALAESFEATEGLARARSQLIARRLGIFATGWLVTTAAWLIVFTVMGRLPVVAAAVVLLGQAMLLGGVLALRRPSGAWVGGLTLGMCLALGTGSVLLCTAIRAPGDVLAFILLTLCLMAALVFAWGWRTEVVLLVGTLLPAMVALPRLQFLVAPLELATAVAVGTVVSLAVAEGAARTFRLAFMRRASSTEAAQALATSRDAYREIAERAHDYIWASDLDNKITYANAAAARIVGSTPADIVGRSTRTFITDHPANPPLDMFLARLLAGETIPALVIQWHTVDGPRWMETVHSLALGSNGQPIGIRGISRDVHERIEAEERVRASEERFRAAFGQAPIGMAVVGPDGGVVEVNEAVLDMLGYTREELFARGIDNVTHPDDIPKTVEWRRAVFAGSHATIEKRLVRKNGSIMWGSVSASLIRDAAGNVVYGLSQLQDVTKRKEAEDALRASEARYRDLVESQEDLVVRIDLEGRIIFANEAYERMLGISRSAVLGQQFPFIHEDDVPRMAEAFAAMRHPPFRASAECRGLVEGSWRWFSFKGVAILEDGRPVEFQTVGRDITEQKRDHEDLRRSQEQLRLLAQRQVAIREQERKRLGLDLHDDVCQELVGIGIMVEAIRRRVGPISTETASEFSRVGRYLGELGDHLRLLARDLQPLQLHDLGLGGSLRSLTKGMSSETCAAEATFLTPIPRLTENAEVGVYRIAQEALTNAVRHSDAEVIELTLAVVGSKLRLEITDDGRGFDRDECTDALGLVSMEERALSLGGQLSIYSSPDKGTTIRLECPLHGHKSASVA